MSDFRSKTLTEFIDILSQLQGKYDPRNLPESSLVYRGQTNAAYKLLPAVYRKIYANNKNEPLSPAEASQNEQIVIENNLYGSNEIPIMKSFKQEARSILNNVDDSDWVTWLEYAQHFGVPTRLLDWTKNPLVALYFACNELNGEDGIVYTLNRVSFTLIPKNAATGKNIPIKKIIYNQLIGDESYLEQPVLYAPPYSDIRMAVQGSMFMLWGKDKRDLETIVSAIKVPTQICKKDSDGVSYSKCTNDDSLLNKILIPADCKKTILKQLDLCGINEKFLFPGLDGIGKYIERKYSNDMEDIIESF